MKKKDGEHNKEINEKVEKLFQGWKNVRCVFVQD